MPVLDFEVLQVARLPLAGILCALMIAEFSVAQAVKYIVDTIIILWDLNDFFKIQVPRYKFETLQFCDTFLKLRHSEEHGLNTDRHKLVKIFLKVPWHLLSPIFMRHVELVHGHNELKVHDCFPLRNKPLPVDVVVGLLHRVLLTKYLFDARQHVLQLCGGESPVLVLVAELKDVQDLLLRDQFRDKSDCDHNI